MFLSIGPRGRGRNRVRFHQIAGAALVFFVMLSILRMARRARLARSSQRSIYDYTEGKVMPAAAAVVAGATTTTTSSSPEGEMARYLRDLVSRHGLTQEITFHARRIQPSFNTRQKRESMTVVRKKLGPRHGFATITVPAAAAAEEGNRNELKRGSQQQQPLLYVVADTDSAVLKLPLPGPPELPDQVDASALLFGIATSYSRLVASNASLLHDWARWLTDGRGRSNGAGLLLVLHHASTSEVGHVSSKLRELGIDAEVRSSAGDGNGIVGGNSPDGDDTWSYLELVGHLAMHAQDISKEVEHNKKKKKKEKKYLGLVDDDIFFPSMHRLLARLGGLDPAENAYVGLPSEKADWTTTEGGNVTMTYGGGAVFVTRPMADAISKMPCALQSQQIEQKPSSGVAEEAATTTGQWDERLYRCITAHHSSRLRIMQSLYTPDDEADDGGYESGLRPLTLHHYRQRHQRFAPSGAHLVTSLTGEGSFLQRFLFRGDGWVLVNGHSIAEYPDGVDVVPLSHVSNQKKLTSSVFVTQQPHEITYDDNKNMEHNNNEGGAVRLASRITIESDAAQKQERKYQKAVSWTGVKRVWRHLDSRIVRDETGAVKEVWQAYVKRTGAALEYDDDRLDPSDTVHRQDGVSDLNSVIVLIWERPS
ncbi:Ph signal transduction protein [Apiospora phragmitis]|uniref:Ph signal transduction protein n=1 Tax=Apiospora phragmitis TaxID=2905665 RepID=A0ABR1T843_9PEZI